MRMSDCNKGMNSSTVYLQKGVFAYCTNKQMKEDYVRHTVEIDKLTTMFDDVLPGKVKMVTHFNFGDVTAPQLLNSLNIAKLVAIY